MNQYEPIYPRKEEQPLDLVQPCPCVRLPGMVLMSQPIYTHPVPSTCPVAYLNKHTIGIHWPSVFRDETQVPWVSKANLALTHLLMQTVD